MTRNTNFALTLSAGALVGLMALASASAPALARGNGGGGAAGGGENGNVMAAVNIANVPERGRPQGFPQFNRAPCGQEAGVVNLRQCNYVGTRRVVHIYR